MAKPAGKVPDHLRSEISLRVHPQDWLATARKLKKAADLLLINFETEQVKFNEEFEEDCDTDLPRPDDTVVTMLLGFAVENLLKGLLVSTLEHVEGVKDLSELPAELRRHELKPIACVVKPQLHIEFSREELDLLDALTYVILWYGRYPSARNMDGLIPLYWNPLSSPTGFAPGDDAHGHYHFKKFFFNYPADYLATLKLYDRLETILQNQAPNGQPAGPAGPAGGSS